MKGLPGPGWNSLDSKSKSQHRKCNSKVIFFYFVEENQSSSSCFKQILSFLLLSRREPLVSAFFPWLHVCVCVFTVVVVSHVWGGLLGWGGKRGVVTIDHLF